MVTTTIRIQETMKARINAAAERAGNTHAIMLDAIEQSVEQAELDEAFHRIADERWAKILATGKTVPWDEARGGLEARARGEHPRKPVGASLAASVPHAAHCTRARGPRRFRSLFFPHGTVRYRRSTRAHREIVQALQVLSHSPLIGRPVRGGKRELVIGRDARGCVAQYRYVPGIDTVFVLAIRSQKETLTSGTAAAKRAMP